ncbi:hypothetical protein JXJ21_02505 [candidate division KSB1 bacterium]|nr:hypothetical protein [candidate division KSB1 bacterium]
MTRRIVILLQLQLVFISGTLLPAGSQLDIFQTNLAAARQNFQTADTLLQALKIADAMKAYLAGRQLLKDSFFALLLARQKDSLSAEVVTTAWDSAVASMRIRLKGIDDCEFERCFIYNEEKAANVCINVIRSQDSTAFSRLMDELKILFDSEENLHLKLFFGKIYDYILLKSNLATFRLVAFADSAAYAAHHKRYGNFVMLYRNYKARAEQNNR